MTALPHHRVQTLETRWPDPPFQVALIEPQIPPNTGNIARLCAATGSVLHLVGRLGFNLDDRHLRRAGLDYWSAVNMQRHPETDPFLSHCAANPRCFYFSTAGSTAYDTIAYRPGDILAFGNEQTGLPDTLLNAYPDQVCAIPLRVDAVRSLNLATAVAIVLYEALRQYRRHIER